MMREGFWWGFVGVCMINKMKFIERPVKHYARESGNSSYKINKSMETSMARLSSGKRINSATDDAAGIQIATRMDTEVRGLNQAVRNAADAQSMLMILDLMKILCF